MPGIDVLAERDRAGFPDWRIGYVARFAVAALSDDRNTCKPVIEGRDWHKAYIWKLLTELPEGGGQELRRLESCVREEPKLRRLVGSGLVRKAAQSVMSPPGAGGPATNNGTEQTIGRSKVGYKTARGYKGYKSAAGMRHGLGLTQWAWSGHNGRDPGKLAGV